MRLRDSYSWWTWAERLPTDAPSDEILREAERYPFWVRECLNAWLGSEPLPIATIARAFPCHSLSKLGDEHQVEHVTYMRAAALERQLESVPESARGFAVWGDGGLSETDSKEIVRLHDRHPEALFCEGPPLPEHLGRMRNTLKHFDLRLPSMDRRRDRHRFDALFAEPWPALESLRLETGDSKDMALLTDLLPSFDAVLPVCRDLNLYETSSGPSLMTAMTESLWIARLEGLQVHDAELSRGALAKLGSIPFERLDYLGLGALEASTRTAKALAKSPHLKTVTALEIAGKVGRDGVAAVLDAWPNLRAIAIWDSPHYDDVEAVIEGYALHAFVRGGGEVQARIC